MSPKVTTVNVRLADAEPVRRVLAATAALAEEALDAANALEVSENYETSRYVAEGLRDAVEDFRKALGANMPGDES